jgi:Lectin C-type domain
MARTSVLAALVVLLTATSVGRAQVPVHFRYNLATQRTYLLTPDGLSWHTARDYARSLGGYLVAVNSAAEETFLTSAFENVALIAWIGLSDEAVEGVYVWESGEPLVYTDWCSGDPNNSLGVEDWVRVYFPGFGGHCWSDVPSFGDPTWIPNHGIVELPHGDRVNFDGLVTSCTNQIPTPLNAPGNAEGVSWNGASASFPPAIASTVVDGMPVSGTRYLHISSEGIVNLPPGGQLPRPVPASVNEVRIAIPAGAKGVSFAWEFLSGESDPAYNDGVSIAIVDAAGNLIMAVGGSDVATSSPPLVFASYCNLSAVNAPSPAGPRISSFMLPPLPYPAYLSFACWNGIDNLFSSGVNVDAFHFWGQGQFKLTITAPFGPGSIRLANTGGGGGNGYWTAVTLTQGAFPNGWLFGVDVGLPELLGEVTSGVPFSGTLDGIGGSIFTIPAGVPPGLPLYAVSIHFDDAPSGGEFLGASAPEFFLTP